MRVLLVCGGRDYADRATVYRYLDAAHATGPIDRLVHGGSAGADTLAEDWARARGVNSRAHPARWEVYGKRAGPLRNQLMLDEERPQMVIAFPGGRGTADMVSRAKRSGVELLEVQP